LLDLLYDANVHKRKKMTYNLQHSLRFLRMHCSLQGGPTKRIPSIIFGISSVIQHRF